MFYELDRSHGDLPIKSEKLDGMGGQMLQLPEQRFTLLIQSLGHTVTFSQTLKVCIVVYAGSMVCPSPKK